MMRNPQINKVEKLGKKENVTERKLRRFKKLLLVRDVRGSMLEAVY